VVKLTRLSEGDAVRLAQVAALWKVSEAEALRRAFRDAADAVGVLEALAADAAGLVSNPEAGA
jgi:hypothetical protein